MVLEFDGPVHHTDERKKIDHKRDTYLHSQGFTVLRFDNKMILETPEIVFQKIADAAANPSPVGRRDGMRVTGFRDRRGETLFIDARKMGHLIDRTHRELSDEEISRIAQTYHAWSSISPSPSGRGQGEGIGYVDIPGFCKSTTIEEIRAHGYVLTPGRYVGTEDIADDDEPFADKMKRLTEKLEEQLRESAKLEVLIKKNLEQFGV